MSGGPGVPLPIPREAKTLFAYAPAVPDGVPVVTVLIPEKAWAYMIDGNCHDYDMTNIGIPLRLIIGRCHDHADGMTIFEQANGGALKRHGFVDIRDGQDA